MGHSMSMIDVGEKPITRRTARVSGVLHARAETLGLVRDGKLKKGNALGLAEAAALYAAKRTPEWLALCHPLLLDRTDVTFVLAPTTVTVTVECVAHGKTGVEMEALTACSAALLSLYDVLKAHDDTLMIGELRVLEKTGGVSATARAPALASVRASVLTISDRCSRGEAVDQSGPALREYLAARGAEVHEVAIVADEVDQIIRQLHTWREQRVGLVLCTGGTGLSPRDVTPEALRALGGREVEGFGERLRFVGGQHKRTASLSRSLALAWQQQLIVALPGSLNAVAESLPVLDELLPHALHVLRGGDHGK